MLTREDYQNILAILVSPQLTINAAQASLIVALQQKLLAIINAPPPSPVPVDIGPAPAQE